MIKIDEEDLVTLDDGFIYFWPEGSKGCFSSAHLRDIADQLDEMNKDWAGHMETYFAGR